MEDRSPGNVWSLEKERWGGENKDGSRDGEVVTGLVLNVRKSNFVFSSLAVCFYHVKCEAYSTCLMVIVEAVGWAVLECGMVADLQRVYSSENYGKCLLITFHCAFIFVAFHFFIYSLKT
jgi:hypothetical protein